MLARRHVQTKSWQHTPNDFHTVSTHSMPPKKLAGIGICPECSAINSINSTCPNPTGQRCNPKLLQINAGKPMADLQLIVIKVDQKFSLTKKKTQTRVTVAMLRKYLIAPQVQVRFSVHCPTNQQLQEKMVHVLNSRMIHPIPQQGMQVLGTLFYIIIIILNNVLV